MTDVHSSERRSFNMSRIKGKDTKPELLVRKFLFSHGLRYRIHEKKLPGKPDLVFPKYQTVIFIHGCFWHGHKDCKYAVVPKTRTEWWVNKIEKNKLNDKKNASLLQDMGYRLLHVWECDLKPEKREKTLNNILREFF